MITRARVANKVHSHGANPQPQIHATSGVRNQTREVQTLMARIDEWNVRTIVTGLDREIVTDSMSGGIQTGASA